MNVQQESDTPRTADGLKGMAEANPAHRGTSREVRNAPLSPGSVITAHDSNFIRGGNTPSSTVHGNQAVRHAHTYGSGGDREPQHMSPRAGEMRNRKHDQWENSMGHISTRLWPEDVTAVQREAKVKKNPQAHERTQHTYICKRFAAPINASMNHAFLHAFCHAFCLQEETPHALFFSFDIMKFDFFLKKRCIIYKISLIYAGFL